MRKLLVIAASIFVLTMGAAFAQDDDTALDVAPDGDTWVGASTGYPFGLTAHYGLGNALGDGIDLRFNGQFSFAGSFGYSAIGFNLGADALFNIPVEADDVKVYAGAGPKLGFILASTNLGIGGASAGGFQLGAQGLAGAEYLVTDDIGVFGELRVGLSYLSGFGIGFDPALFLGANYHF